MKRKRQYVLIDDERGSLYNIGVYHSAAEAAAYVRSWKHETLKLRLARLVIHKRRLKCSAE